MSLITVKNLSFSYENSYDMVFEQVNFQLDTNWKLGFTGRNGCGKRTSQSLIPRSWIKKEIRFTHPRDHRRSF